MCVCVRAPRSRAAQVADLVLALGRSGAGGAPLAPGIHSALPVLTSVCVHQRLVVGVQWERHKGMPAQSGEGKVVGRLRRSGATGRLGRRHRGQAARQWEQSRVEPRPPGALALTMQALSRCSVWTLLGPALGELCSVNNRE